MRIAILSAGLVVLLLTGIGICHSQGLFKPGSSQEVEVKVEVVQQSPPGNESAPVSEYERRLANLEGRKAFASEHLKFQSLLDRLPRGRGIAPTKGLDNAARARWQNLDGEFTRIQAYRVELLKAYHEKTFKFFVSSPGQGPLRGSSVHHDEERNIAFVNDEVELLNLEESGTEEQRGRPATFPDTPGELLNRIPADEELYSRHRRGLRCFLNPFGFGLARSREQVSGFSSHRMQLYRDVETLQLLNADADDEPLLIEHVLLVGILQHERPLVYLTDKMPSMEQVRQGKTRPLDRFEEAALPSLVEGEDLFIARKDQTLRMLGAIRATSVCLQCHDANVGDMLGAFTYTLRLNTNK